MRCLLVDDEPGIREGMAMLLRRRGYEVRTAGDCADARRLLASEDFDAIVTDWRLPDGDALDYIREQTVPVIAVSGHAEEVGGSPAIREVLSKPVSPDRLCKAIVACAAPAPTPAPAALSPPVQAVLDGVAAQLPAGTPQERIDDGPFVVVRFPLAAGPVPRSDGGDLRVVGDGPARQLELRMCRDGRPDAEMPVVPPDGPFPSRGRFAIDCSGLTLGPDEYRRWLDGVAAGGGRACLLDVPPALEETTVCWENTHDMPMRARVGPQLSAELIELWS